ncbi:DUF1080 domain-containing protein [Sphingobacterium spiritivorum]|uniref:DUF1080 domain-containing protein n=1 Tax=Sphingobacterium spiritivorum TaxID=258 RepID=UPI003DA2F1FE
MKKTFNILSALLILQVAAHAQLPSNRTTATKIADVLAQQPAEEKAKFLAAMKELENFSSEDIAELLAKLQPQGGNNATIEFASNSYSFYVMQSGMEARRETFAKGLIAALDKLTDKDNKGYVIKLLQQSGKNEAVAPLTSYLKDDYLVGKASRALVAINTEDARKALLTSLTDADSETKKIAIVTALGDLRSAEAEAKIIELIQSTSAPKFQKAAFTALSKIGGEKSASVFTTQLAIVKYQYEPNDITGLAVDYAETLLKNKKSAQAEKFAAALFAGAGVNNAPETKIAALSILTNINASKQKKALLTAATSEDAAYRNVALQLLGEYGNSGDTKKLIAALKSATPAVQESILDFLAQKGSASDVSTLQKIVLNNTTGDARISGLEALDALSRNNVTPLLISQLKDADEALTSAIQKLILASKEAKAIDIVNESLATADAKTQIALLGILAKRPNAKSSKAVLPLAKATDEKVRIAAYQALPTVASEDDLNELYALFSTANKNEVAYLQKATINAIQSSKDKDAITTKLASNVTVSAAPSAGMYFPVFAGLGGTESLNAVKNFTDAGIPEVKTQAISALASWKTAEALPALVALSRTEKGEGNFDTIFKGLIRLVNSSSLTPDQKTLHLKDAFAIARTDAQRNQVLSSLQGAGTYQAMIFASKQMDNPALAGAASNTAMNIAFDHKEYVGEDVRNILNKVIGNLSGSESSYLKEAVLRQLAEMPNKEGFVSVFNGNDLSGWKGLVADPIKRSKMDAKTLAAEQKKADEKMRAGWQASKGELIFNGKGDNIATIKQYGDMEMLVDWKLDKDGKEGDAGVYLRGTPQVQIWDISRTNVGAQVGSGGLYNNQKNAKDPLVVADNPLGEWNTFKIKMVDDKVTVYLNGVLVTDNVPLENYWDRNQSIFPTEQIELQAHGTKVYYRDIFIKELPRKQVSELSAQEKREGFDMLFDGTNLDKWIPSDGYGINEEGYLVVYPNAKFGGNLYTKDEYSDVVYRFEFKLTPGANNGVGLRAPVEGDAAYAGMEIQILDNDADVYKNLKPYQYHGSVYGVITAKRGALKPVGEWNTEEIRLQGNKIKVTVNGTVILEGDIAEASKNGTLDGKSHPGLQRKSGHIAFLGHGSEVFFRNIRVKKL